MGSFMDTKQKSLLVLTLVALGFLGYQVFQLVDRDITETPVIAEQSSAAIANATSSVKASMAVSPIAKVAQVTTSAAVPATPAQPLAKKASVTAEAVTPQQHAYMKVLNSYEIARMHHQLMDEEAAIATAQQKIAVMHTKTQKLLGPNAATSDNLLSTQGANAISLSYIDKQNDHWSATLHIGSEYESVQIGSQLPNGYDVIGIDHQGVMLQKGNQRERVSFNGVRTLPPALLGSVAQHAMAAGEQQQVSDTVKAIKVTHGTVGEQANLLAMQLVHHGSEVQALARHGLAAAPMQTALKNNKPVKTQLDGRLADGLPYQISIHDANADEAADDLDNTQLSMDLHLRSVAITPVMNQPYNTGAYLPQQAAVPQAYHLAGDNSTDDEQYYASESRDDQGVILQKAALTKNKVLSLPDQYYTIQLLGSAHSDIVSKFIHQNDLNNNALTLSVGTHEHPWVIALYGVYHSFDAAEEKLVHLPANMRMGGAWIRRIGDVQKVVRGRG